jgi:transposase
MALRARIVLASASGATNQEVAAQLGVNPTTVGKWRNRFVARGLDGLSDDPRPGAPRRITDDRVEQVIMKTLEEIPEDSPHWSTRSMAAATGLSQTAVSRIWRSFGLQPQRAVSFKRLTDPAFIAKVCDVVGLYLDFPERALVLASGDDPQPSSEALKQPHLPILPVTPGLRNHDDASHGATSLYAVLDAASAKVLGSIHRRQRVMEFKAFLERVDGEVPSELNVDLILDDYATHKAPVIYRWLTRHPRFQLHFVPTGFAWLNLVERWFAELTARELRQDRACSMPGVEQDINDWIDTSHDNPRPFAWAKTTDQLLTAGEDAR